VRDLRNAYRILVQIFNAIDDFGDTHKSIYGNGYKTGPGEVYWFPLLKAGSASRI
jgi:hypothetical protein